LLFVQKYELQSLTPSSHCFFIKKDAPFFPILKLSLHFNMNQEEPIDDLWDESDEAPELVKKEMLNVVVEPYHQTLALAAYLNNDLNADNANYKLNDKQVQALRIKEMLMGMNEFNPEQITYLQNLANSCIYLEGKSVLASRAYENLWNHGTIYDDRVLCGNIAQRGAALQNYDQSQQEADSIFFAQLQAEAISNNLTKGSAVLYPNPSKGKITIAYKELGGDATCNFYNSLGQLMQTMNLPADQYSVSIDAMILSAGTYSYKIAGSNTTINGKLQINK
jgi:Secretion system C-terminal sorting domain